MGLGFLQRAGLTVLCAIALPLVATGQSRTPAPATFTRDVAPIFERSCVVCHNPNGIGPMPLTNFEDVRPWARSIRQKTSQREMPPWFVEKHIGIQRFKDDISLTDEEIDTIARWVEGGAPQGDPADLPPRWAAATLTEWSIGTPDLILSSPTLTIDAVAADFMTDIGPVPTHLTEARYVQAIEVREVTRSSAGAAAGGRLNYFLVHHATVSIVEADAARTDSEPMEEGGGRRLVFYQMGQNPTVYPENVGALLPAGSALNFGIHIHAVGEAMPVRLDVAIRFHPRGYTPKHVLSSFSASPRGQQELLDLPAGESNIRVDGYTPITRPMKLVTFVPHLHANGTRMCIEAIYPDGRTEVINCSRWNHNWSRQYFYEDEAAPLFPAGTLIHLVAWFDNSANNPRNVEPRNWKGYGNRTHDDMAYLLSEAIYLTEEEFQAEVAARAARQQ